MRNNFRNLHSWRFPQRSSASATPYSALVQNTTRPDACTKDSSLLLLYYLIKLFIFWTILSVECYPYSKISDGVDLVSHLKVDRSSLYYVNAQDE